MDVVIEVRDARIPMSTSHPQMDLWLGNRKRILVLNREDMTSAADRNAWASYYANQGTKVVFANGKLGMGALKMGRLAKTLAAGVNIERRAKGLLPRPVRAGIVGYQKCWQIIFDQPFAEAAHVSSCSKTWCYQSTETHMSFGRSVHIVQRGAVDPLIELAQSQDLEVQVASTFVLGILARDTHSQAGIAQSGGIVPLLNLLDSSYGTVQQNAAFVLYVLTKNEVNVVNFITAGGVQKLEGGEFLDRATKYCVAKTLEMLERKINGRVLSHLLYLMRAADRSIKRSIALALARLCSPEDQESIFIKNRGLDILLYLLESWNLELRQLASEALYKLADKAGSLFPVDTSPTSSNSSIYLGREFVNNPTLSDVTFLIEGKPFHAYKIWLLRASDAFQEFFDSGYMEREAQDIEISDIRWEVFELMMRCSRLSHTFSKD